MSYLPIQLSPEQQLKYDQMRAQAMQEGRPWGYGEHIGAIMAVKGQPSDPSMGSEPGGFTGGGSDIYPHDWNDWPIKPIPYEQPTPMTIPWAGEWPNPTQQPGKFQKSSGGDRPGTLIPLGGQDRTYDPRADLYENGLPHRTSIFAYSSAVPSPQQNNKKFFSYLQNTRQKRRNNLY